MKIATQHYQDSVITPYGNNHWNGKEKIDISKEKDDAVILEISAKGKRAIQLKEKNEFEQNIVQVDKSADVPTKRIENGSIDCGLLGNFRFFVDIPERIRSADAWQN